MIVIRNRSPCCLLVLSNIILINYNSVGLSLQSQVIINYNSVVMSLQSHMTYFLHVHTGTGAGAGAGVGDNRGTETMTGVPQWGQLIPPDMDTVMTSQCGF